MFIINICYKKKVIYSFIISILFCLLFASNQQVNASKVKPEIQRTTINTNNQIIDLFIEESDVKNVVTFFENGKYNVIEYYKQSEILAINSVKNDMFESMEKPPMSRAVPKGYKLFNKINGNFKIDGLSIVAIAAAITAVTGPGGISIALGLATTLAGLRVKNAYYTKFMYRGPKIKNSNNRYKWYNVIKFYSNSKRTKVIKTIG